ncbi:hypothetical protein PENTCL1PPCAC_1297, partial [Pristionchus entomophagus]
LYLNGSSGRKYLFPFVLNLELDAAQGRLLVIFIINSSRLVQLCFVEAIRRLEIRRRLLIGRCRERATGQIFIADVILSLRLLLLVLGQSALVLGALALMLLDLLNEMLNVAPQISIFSSFRWRFFALYWSPRA